VTANNVEARFETQTFANLVSMGTTEAMNVKSQGATIEHRFQVYTMAAGVQYASFQECKCKNCKLFFLGGWQYKKPQQSFGHATDMRFIGSQLDEQVVIVPKYKSWHAVETKLLKSCTSELAHGGSTFAAVVIRWLQQHPEALQQQLIAGGI
jgi:hypothetical protein